MTTLNEFYQEVSDELKRGTSFDSIIPNKVSHAVQHIEAYKASRGDWQHMVYFKEFTVSASSNDPTAISLPTGIKKIKFLRYKTTASDGTIDYVPLRRYLPEQIFKKSNGLPTGYWQDGRNYLFLDNVIEDDLDFEIGCIVKSTIPANEDEEWDFLEDFKSALFPLTMFMLGPVVRMNMNTVQLYNAQYSSAIQLLDLEDEELRYSNGNNKILYTGDR